MKEAARGVLNLQVAVFSSNQNPNLHKFRDYKKIRGFNTELLSVHTPTNSDKVCTTLRSTYKFSYTFRRVFGTCSVTTVRVLTIYSFNVGKSI